MEGGYFLGYIRKKQSTHRRFSEAGSRKKFAGLEGLLKATRSDESYGCGRQSQSASKKKKPTEIMMKDQNIASLQDGEDHNVFASKKVSFPSDYIDVQERRHERPRKSKSRRAGRPRLFKAGLPRPADKVIKLDDVPREVHIAIVVDGPPLRPPCHIRFQSPAMAERGEGDQTSRGKHSRRGSSLQPCRKSKAGFIFHQINLKLAICRTETGAKYSIYQTLHQLLSRLFDVALHR